MIFNIFEQSFRENSLKKVFFEKKGKKETFKVILGL